MSHPFFRSTAAAAARRRQAGGAVLALVVSLLVMAAATLAIRLAGQVSEKTAQQQLTQQRMARIGKALQAYWAVHGCVLPTGALGSASTGDAAPGGTTVPWRTLGLARDDAFDAWGRKISYQSPASVAQFGAPAQPQTWALVSHGPTGLGAWLASGQPMPPPANADELANASGGVLQLKTETAGSDVAPGNLFDDALLWGMLDTADCAATPPITPPVVGAPTALNLTTALLNSIAPVSYSGRDSNTTSITIDGGAALGNITITSSGGNISRNGVPNGTAIGVCTTGCGNNNNSSLSFPETLSFKLDGKIAEKFALGVLSLDPTVQVAVTFRRNGSDIGLYVSPVVPAVGGAVTIFADLAPSPTQPFDEVVVQPLGSSHFFVASIRFCAAGMACN